MEDWVRAVDLIGVAVFALSGIRAVVLVIPLALHGRLGMTLLGIALFGVGVIVSMTLFGLLVFRGAELAARLKGGARAVEMTAGALAIGVGGYWLITHLG